MSSWQNTAVHSAGGHGGGRMKGCCGDSGEPEMQMLHSMGASVALDTFLVQVASWCVVRVTGRIK